MSGLLMGMFVAILAGTVVSTALPQIIHQLGGGQTSYTWVVTASLLATTVTTPVWGKLADLLDRKVLIQLSLIIFTVGSALCGFAQDPGTLIGFRVLQGVGSGGMMALVQIVMADIVSPRERGKYMGLIGAVMAVGTVGGPLLGGVITDLWNWRWVFYVALPVAVVALIVLQKTLHVPPRRPGKVRIDYLGTTLIASGVSLLLVWVSLGGNTFPWVSATSGLMLGLAIALLVALVFVELRAAEPVIPMTLFKNRTFTMSVVASIAVGVGMFGTTVYLTEYMQLGRGATATMSGIMTFPLVAGLMVCSAVAGALISKRGYWKSYMVAGSILMTVGLALMGTIAADTHFALVSIYMVVLGSGVGMVMQNLVLIVQNDVDPREIGVASSGVAFFRTLGGTIGVSALGAILTTRLADLMGPQLADIQQAAATKTAPTSALGQAVLADGDAGSAVLQTLAGGGTPDVNAMLDSGASNTGRVVGGFFGDAIAELFWVSIPLGLLTILAVVFLPNKPLGRKTTGERIGTGEDTAAGFGADSRLPVVSLAPGDDGAADGAAGGATGGATGATTPPALGTQSATTGDATAAAQDAPSPAKVGQ